MKSILFFVNPNCGGAERITLLYSKILKSNGFFVKLCVCMDKGSDFNLFSFIPTGIPCDIIEYSKYRLLPWKIANYLRHSRFDVIFSSLPLLSLPLLVLKKIIFRKIKVVVRECNMPSTHSKRELRLSRYLYKYADVVISQTCEMKAEIEKFYHLRESDIVVINNPIDKELIRTKAEEDVDIEFDDAHVKYIACGRLSPQKDIPTLLKAFAILQETVSNAVLYLIGKADSLQYLAELKSLVEELGISKSVVFLGFQTNPYKYMNMADVFVLSSSYEGLPNVMLEAMYMGKPIAVTSCIPYISRVIHNGLNGYLAEVGNPVSLANAMLKANTITNLPVYYDAGNSESLIVDVFNLVV